MSRTRPLLMASRFSARDSLEKLNVRPAARRSRARCKPNCVSRRVVRSRRALFALMLLRDTTLVSVGARARALGASRDAEYEYVESDEARERALDKVQSREQ